MKTIALTLALLAGCLTDSTTDESTFEDETSDVESFDLEATEATESTDVPCDEPALESATTLFYGSTFASNCSCSFCTRYCTVNGTTYKSGTCC